LEERLGVTAADPLEDPSPERVGVLLLNLGSPDSPSTRDVRSYLREFLGDPRVLDMHPILRALLLHCVILPFRPRRSAAAYRKVWTAQGSPLLVESRSLRANVAARLGAGFHVALAMRYGSPSIRSALDELLAEAPQRLVVMPLFPQYAEASTGSCLARVHELLDEAGGKRPAAVHCIPAFYDEPGYIAGWTAVARDPIEEFAPDHVLFSYHGLPEAQIRHKDASRAHCLSQPSCCDEIGTVNRMCYRAHCFATSRALASALTLEPGSWSLAFQSRLGPIRWIRPYTDRLLPELAKRGKRRLAVLCPAFVADCLETLEEVGIRLRAQWGELGGDELLLIPCPNAHPTWSAAVADLVRAAAQE
jgi:ferrochelatase